LVVKMEWIDSVFSLAYQRANVASRARPNKAVVVSSAPPKLSTRLSVMRVPTMLISTTFT